uniref:Autophagy-related protein 2 n=1 Tax=Albugo laibachii Nc14 TaxID=890382 RepID=F0X170_9STRA|nr:autophagyrelated protein putative [Albugo laibachii Nc14]|eukprot:CCA27528.1 autophagyrelated protein putative [Albugo laibachii Nc14]
MQFLRQLTDPALKRLYKFVLKRLIGRYLAHDELDLDQLDVHVRAGKIELCDLKLNADVLNAEWFDFWSSPSQKKGFSAPFRIEKGYIGSVRVTISYAKILTESCTVEFDDIELLLVPNKVQSCSDPKHDRPVEESAHMNSSNDSDPKSIENSERVESQRDLISQEGLDFVASWIEQVTARIKVTVSNVCARLEAKEEKDGAPLRDRNDKSKRYKQEACSNESIALLLKLNWAQFTDESVAHNGSAVLLTEEQNGDQGGTRSLSGSVIFGITQKIIKFRGISVEIVRDNLTGEEGDCTRWPLLLCDTSRQGYVQVKLAQHESTDVPSIDADIFVHSSKIILQPRYLKALATLIDAFHVESTDKDCLQGGDMNPCSMRLYHSICKGHLSWLEMKDDERESDGEDKKMWSLSIAEFERIEEMLMRYRSTKEELQVAQRSYLSGQQKSDLSISNSYLTPGNLNTESVECSGLSDVEDDGFFECNPGMGQTGNFDMRQSIYASTMDESDMMNRSRALYGKNKSSEDRTARNRAKLHLLEFVIIIFYEDAQDDEDRGSSDSSHEHSSKSVPIGILDLESRERLTIAMSDVLCSVISYSSQSTISAAVENLDISEHAVPSLGTISVGEAQPLLTNPILRFSDSLMQKGQEIQSASAISISTRTAYGSSTSMFNDAKTLSAINIQVRTRPFLVEWDMYILNRALNFLQALEEYSENSIARTEGTDLHFVSRTLEISTEGAQFVLRFPMIGSDVIRYGPSSKRGLCEDKLVITLRHLGIKSETQSSKNEGEKPKRSSGVPIEWLMEYRFEFDHLHAELCTKKDDNQRAGEDVIYTLVDGTKDLGQPENHSIIVRVQDPSQCTIDEAIKTRAPFDEAIKYAAENDSGRVGLKGWGGSTHPAAQIFECAASHASLYFLDVNFNNATITFSKPSLGRLLVLFDALLSINPIEVNEYNAAIVRGSRPNYMSMKLTLPKGTLELQRGTEAGVPGVFSFAFQDVKLFQISQWLGQVVSLVHVSVQNVTMTEETLESKKPILYRTPFGSLDTPVLFIGAEIADVSQKMRDITIGMHVSHGTLRFDPTSQWLFELLDILVFEYPAPIIPFDSADLNETDYETIVQQMRYDVEDAMKLAVPTKIVFTKIPIKLYNVVIDYAPVNVDSHAILVIGSASISSNIVSTATLLGYKIVAKDVGLFLRNSGTNYEDIDRLIGHTRRPHNSSTMTNTSHASDHEAIHATFIQQNSLHMSLDSTGYLKIVTLDYMEIFLKSLASNSSAEMKLDSVDSTDRTSTKEGPQLSVELSLGTATVYACFDSFCTLTELVSVLAEELNRADEPRDVTGYVGLDRIQTLSNDTCDIDDRTQNSRLATSAGKVEVASMSKTIAGDAAKARKEIAMTQAYSHAELINSFGRKEVERSAYKDIMQPSVNLLKDIELNAFRSEYTFCPGILTNDMEARQFQTRLDELDKRKSRILGKVRGSSGDNFSVGKSSENSRTSVRISELLIEDYYTESHVEDSITKQSEDRDDSPWFSDRLDQPSASSLGTRSEEQKFVRDTREKLSSSKVDEERSTLEETDARFFTQFSLEEDDDRETTAYPAPIESKDHHCYSATEKDSDMKRPFWQSQATDNERMSEIHTEVSTSSFPTRVGESHEEPSRHTLSMSLFGSEQDETTEVELEFQYGDDLQRSLCHLLDMDDTPFIGNGIPESHPKSESDQKIESVSDRANGYVSHTQPYENREKYDIQTQNQQEIPSFSSVEDEYTACWFHDNQTGGLGKQSSFPHIYQHHVEIPVGGAAASLTFGEREYKIALQSMAKECHASKIEASEVLTRMQFLLRDFNVRIRLFGGSDWLVNSIENDKKVAWNHENKRKNDQAETRGDTRQHMSRQEKLLDALLDDYVPNSHDDPSTSYGSAPTGRNIFAGNAGSLGSGRVFDLHLGSSSLPVAASKPIKSGRKTEEMLELSVSRIQMRLDVFDDSDSQPLASNMVAAIKDLEILDYISTSQIRKMVCYWKSDSIHPRETGSSIMNLSLMTIRPGPNLCVEHRLKMRFLPLRINLDQEVVTFLKQFALLGSTQQSGPKATSDKHMEKSAKCVNAEADSTEMRTPRANIDLKETDIRLGNWFFQSIDIRPCKVKIDYRPNHVDYQALRAGDYFEVINLFVLEGMELVLRRVVLSGIDGWAAVAESVLMSWVTDISRHQIHKCLASVTMPPLRSFANVGSGAADLILLPIEHYGKDRRLVRGIRKGAKSFLKSVTVETLNTASKMAQGTQSLLEQADDLISIGASSSIKKKQLQYRGSASRIKRNSKRLGGGGIRSAQVNGGVLGSRQYLQLQPSNATEGLEQAYDSLARELHIAAKTIVAIPLVEYKKTGSHGYVRSVIRAVPVALLRPMIGATEAMSKALIGVRNAVDPELKEDIDNKFKDFRTA